MAGALLAVVGLGKRVATQGAEEGTPEFVECVEGYHGRDVNSSAEGSNTTPTSRPVAARLLQNLAILPFGPISWL